MYQHFLSMLCIIKAIFSKIMAIKCVCGKRRKNSSQLGFPNIDNKIFEYANKEKEENTILKKPTATAQIVALEKPKEITNLTNSPNLPIEVIKGGNGQLTEEKCKRLGLTLFKKNRFKKLRLLGRGAFGKVSLYWKLDKREKVAIKFFDIKGAKGDQERSNKISSFFAEKAAMETLSMISCDAIVKFKGAYYVPDNEGNVKALVLESEGGDYNMKQILEASETYQSYQPEEILAFVALLSEGFKVLKDRRIYHSDIKLDNIVYSSSKQKFMIIDLGISSFVPLGEDEVGTSGGTSAYFSPEKRLEWESKISSINPFKDDMWAFGICIEKLMGGEINTKLCLENPILNELLLKLKEKDYEKRIDADGLSEFVKQHGLLAQPKVLGLIQKTQEMYNALENIRLKKDGFDKLKRIDAIGLPVHDLLAEAKVSGLIQNTQEMLNALDDERFKKDMFDNCYWRYARAIIPGKKLWEALRMFKEVLSTWRRLYKTDEHLDVANTLHFIARLQRLESKPNIISIKQFGRDFVNHFKLDDKILPMKVCNRAVNRAGMVNFRMKIPSHKLLFGMMIKNLLAVAAKDNPMERLIKVWVSQGILLQAMKNFRKFQGDVLQKGRISSLMKIQDAPLTLIELMQQKRC